MGQNDEKDRTCFGAMAREVYALMTPTHSASLQRKAAILGGGGGGLDV